MSALFLELLNLSFMAGWLVLAVLLARVCLRKAPKYIRCILWGLVGIRLVIPFSVESVFSLLPSGKVIEPEIVYDRTPSISSGITVVDDVTNNLMAESFTPNVADSVNPLQVVTFVASNLWVLGLVIMLVYCVVSYILVRRKVLDAVKLDGNVYESERITTPFVLGIFRPRIYIPYHMEREARECVVAHEMAHIKRGDHIIKLAGFLILAVYWFNPLIWVAHLLLCRDIELACDEKVLKNIGEAKKKNYSKVLLEYSVSPKMIAACPLAFGEVAVKQRIKNALNYKKPAFWIIVVSAIACVVVAVCFMTSPKEEIEGGEPGSEVVTNDMSDDTTHTDTDKSSDKDSVEEHTFIEPTKTEDRLLLMVDDKLYYCTGRESTATQKCGVMDGNIETTVEKGEIPTENNQSNFGTGYGWQRSSNQYEIEVFMPYNSLENKWMRFVEDGKPVGETAFDENTVLVDVDQIFSITMVNGNTGEEKETSRLMSDNTMHELIELYNNLEFCPFDTEQELRVGWQYSMRLYDMDGNLLQIITPYGDTLEINSTIYDSSMNYSSYSLLQYMNYMFHPVEGVPGVYMILEKADVNGAVFSIRNETSQEIIYGEAFTLWVEQNGEWKEISKTNESGVFSERSRTVPAYGSWGCSTIGWEWLYDDMEEGKRYKIATTIRVQDSTGEGQQHVCEHEFVL